MITISLICLFTGALSQLQRHSGCVKLESAYETMCPRQGEETILTQTQGVAGKRGPIGEKGIRGSKGETGAKGELGEPNYDRVAEIVSRRVEEAAEAQARRVSELTRSLSQAKDEIERLKNRTGFPNLGAIQNPALSCQEVKSINASASNGLYYLKDADGNIFQTYCAMNTAGGGWTLVASIHENNMKGKCTTGDRWSSEQGNSAAHPHGDGFWANRATHGEATAASSDDYKNSGYFTMNASNVMIWQVPNDTPIGSFKTSAFLKYHTANGFLQSYGGNLGSLYANHFLMRAKQFVKNTDNGPAIPIVWDEGSNDELSRLIGNVRVEVDVGFVQFRVINYEGNAFALCPGVKIKAGKGNVEHVCRGSTSYNIGHKYEEKYCGDFSAMDWPHSFGWQADQRLIESAVLIFYK